MKFSDLTFPVSAFFLATGVLTLRRRLRQLEEIRLQRADVRRRITLEMMRESDCSHDLRFDNDAGTGGLSEYEGLGPV